MAASSMPIVSKYSNEQIEDLLAAILAPFEAEQAPIDLRLMVLGDATAFLLKQLPLQARINIAEQFGQALKRAVSD